MIGGSVCILQGHICRVWREDDRTWGYEGEMGSIGRGERRVNNMKDFWKTYYICVYLYIHFICIHSFMNDI